MRRLASAAFLLGLALTAYGCATSEEESFACSGRTCADAAGSDGASEDAPAPDDGGDAALDSGPVGPDGSGDVIFPVDDTAPGDDDTGTVDTGPVDTGTIDTGPTCPGTTTDCGASGCKNLAADVKNCGSCGAVCPSRANATESCASSKCGFTCDANYDDCDGVGTNGCEAALRTDENNCGACGTKCATGAVCTAGVCTSTTISVETFEPSWPKSGWIAANGSGAGSANAACAHDGSLGYAPAASNPIHYYRTDVSVGAAGTKVSVWFKTTGTGSTTTSGRAYLGFGANASGTWSLVAAPNTNQLYFERNAPYGTYTSLASKAHTWATNVWHKLEVSFAAGGAVTATVYGADGKTVVTTLATTLAGFAPGGVALRAFHGATCVDTIERQ